MIGKKTFQYIIVVPAVDNYVLDFAPRGWEDKTEVSFKRSEVYFGQTKSVSVPLEFVEDGAKILRSLYYQYNTQANAFLQINKLNPSTVEYELAYYGKLDFTSEACKDTDYYFAVPAIEAGIATKIKAFENVKYEFPLDVPESIELTLTPLSLIESAQFIFIPSELDQQPGFTALSIVTNEIKSVNQSVKEAGYQSNANPNFATSDQWHYNAQIANTVKYELINVRGSIQTFLSGEHRFRLQLVKNNGTIVKTFYDRSINNTVEAFEINDSVDVPLVAGEKLFLYQRVDGPLNSDTGFNWYEGQMNLSYATQSPETKCKAFRPKYLFGELLKKMNGGFPVEYSSALLDQWQQLTITSGDAIRRIPGAKVKTSFSDFFKSISAVTCAGHGVEKGKPTIEGRQSYFRPVKTLSMLDSTNVEISVAKDLIFNSIKAGYPNQTYDEINGKEEINSQQNYVIDSVGIVRELDIMSTYRADAYGIEFLRINLDGKSTTDSDSDNDVFFVYVERQAQTDGSFKPFRDGDITGVSAGSSFYNWYISPKRNLKRWGSYLRSIYYNNDGYQIRFTQALKNANVTTSVFGNSVIENANVYLSELDAPYFIPLYADFDTKLPFDLWRYFESGVYGYGEFSFKDVALQGFFIESDIDLALNSSRRFRLLLTVKNDLLQLVK